MSFPKNFWWGAASASAQIEGAYLEDGRTPSIWDEMDPSKIKHGEDCHVACDHYHHYKEDIEYMKKAGLKAYRFSISWSRIIQAKNTINPKGIEFYNNLINELIASHIEPMITLYHSDVPVWVLNQGAFENDETINDFAFYAKVVAENFSDRVKYFFTINEPQCILNDLVNVYHQNAEKTYRGLLLAHGKAVKTLRENAKQPLQISIVMMGMAISPVPGALPEDKTEIMQYSDIAGWMGMVRFTDPIYLGVVPESCKSFISEDDIKIIHQELDIFCLNVYGAFNYYDNPARKNPLIYPGFYRSQIGMPVTPNILYYSAKAAFHRYNKPILFTENGFSNNDAVMSDGKIHDVQRIDYIRSYLKGLEKVFDDNIPVIGYLYWSILDNFEWFHGYDMRFRLIYIDYRTQKRTPKDSLWYYRKIIETNGEYLKTEEKENYPASSWIMKGE